MTTDVLAEFRPTLQRAHEKNLSMPWQDDNFYKVWLAQSYYFVKHSTRLLAFASSHTRMDQSQIHIRMAKHITEEAFHEKLAERDLAAMSCSPGQFSESEMTKLFYRNQYFGIQNFGSCYLLGYILFLEWIAVHSGPHAVATLSPQSRDKASSFLRVHVEEDKDHVEKAIDELNRLAPNDREIAVESFRMAARQYEQILEDCVAASQSRVLSFERKRTAEA